VTVSRFVSQPLTIASGASESGALETEGWYIAAVELPQGTQGAFLEILAGDTPATLRRIFLADAASVNPAQLKLPAALASATITLQLEPLLTAGRQHVAFKTLQSDGATAQAQSADRQVRAYLIKAI
jgi:hypothetical protein